MEHAPGEKAGSSGAGEAMGSGARGAGKGALQNQGRWRHPKSNWMRTGADCAGGESAKVPELELAVRRRTSLPKNARGAEASPKSAALSGAMAIPLWQENGLGTAFFDRSISRRMRGRTKGLRLSFDWRYPRGEGEAFPADGGIFCALC